MKYDAYLASVMKRKSDTFYPEMVPQAALDTIIASHVASAQLVDAAKKALFYGKPNKVLASLIEATPVGDDFEGDEDILHAILGIMTEAAEIGEKRNAPFIELKDELGDLLWYVTLLAECLGTNLEELFKMNDAKLEARFGKRFSSDKAINRDIQNEDKAIRLN